LDDVTLRLFERVLVLVVSALAVSSPAWGSPRIFTYSVAFRGSVTTDRSAFVETVARVYADPRGWSLGNEVVFRQVPSGGDFTIWLASPDEMKSFSDACNPAWSCRTGRNVVINDARWVYGSPFWFGALDAYHVMVVNHETGHWLGFGHQPCPASGSRAPVMMQQSEGAAPCEDNVWPLPTERAALAKMLGIRKPM
jgi:Protein of unknown function (DUF3152)